MTLDLDGARDAIQRDVAEPLASTWSKPRGASSAS